MGKQKASGGADGDDGELVKEQVKEQMEEKELMEEKEQGKKQMKW